MAEGIKSEEERAAEQRRGAAGAATGRRYGPGSFGRPTDSSMDFGPSARRLLRELAPHRMRVGLVVALAVGSVVLSAIGPRVLGRATDLVFAGFIGRTTPDDLTRAEAIEVARATGEADLASVLETVDFVPGEGIDFGALTTVLLLVLGIYVAASVLQWLQGWLLAGVVQDVMFDLRQRVEDKLHRVPLAWVDGQPRGELLSRVTNDLDNVGGSLQQTFQQLMTSLLTIVAVLAMMLLISWKLALVALLVVPASILVTAGIARRSQREFVDQWKRTGALNAIVEETYSAHALVKVYGRSDEVAEAFDETNETLFDSSFRAQFMSGLIRPAMVMVTNLNYVVVAVAGALQVASGQLTLGSVQAFIQYTQQFGHPLAQIASMANVMQSGVASAERVFEVLDADEQRPESVDAVAIADPHGEVVFEDVEFSYTDEPLITDLDLRVCPGETVAIVGETGAGKTTLVNLVMRFYELDGGRITLDGVDITEMTRAGLRGRIGMVLQDTWTFEGSIRDNIAYGRPGATDDEVEAAARAARVDHVVAALPGGYDTVLADEAANLSVGERQLVTIARAFVAQPSLLILDEATSSVDTRTELLVQQAMAELRSDRTSFVIAHRLSTIRDADVILVMADGQIVERGSHDELLEAGGAYAELHAAQFAGLAT